MTDDFGYKKQAEKIIELYLAEKPIAKIAGRVGYRGQELRIGIRHVGRIIKEYLRQRPQVIVEINRK